MTKKVLISLDELNSIRECGNVKGWNCKEWFDAQPDVGLMNINELLGHRDRVCREIALSKMETTGGKDDN